MFPLSVSLSSVHPKLTHHSRLFMRDVSKYHGNVILRVDQQIISASFRKRRWNMSPVHQFRNPLNLLPRRRGFALKQSAFAIAFEMFVERIGIAFGCGVFGFDSSTIFRILLLLFLFLLFAASAMKQVVRGRDGPRVEHEQVPKVFFGEMHGFPASVEIFRVYDGATQAWKEMVENNSNQLR